MITIYGLVDPQTQQIRYVGQTVQNPQSRLRQHICYKDRKTHCACWIRSLLHQNLQPSLQIIEQVEDHLADEREQYWIATLSNLTNHSSGGKRFRHDEITKKRLSAIAQQRTPRKGFNQSDDHKHKIGLANQGSSNGMAKLNDVVAQQIKVLALTSNLKHTEIASIYGVSRRLVGLIAQGQRWKHLPKI